MAPVVIDDIAKLYGVDLREKVLAGGRDRKEREKNKEKKKKRGKDRGEGAGCKIKGWKDPIAKGKERWKANFAKRRKQIGRAHV